MKTVSVVIPFYKGKKWLQEALRSIEEQTILPTEVIIVDDGSDEDLSDLDYNRHGLRVIHQNNQGAAAARNKGIEEAKGDYIAFLDADDYWHPDKIEMQLTAIEQSGAKWSYSRYDKFKDEDGVKPSSKKETLAWHQKTYYPSLLNTCDIATPTVMISRDVLTDNTMRFNTDLKYGEDFCFWIRLSVKYPVTIVENITTSVRIHGNNAARSVSVQLCARKNIRNFVNKNFGFDAVPWMTRFAYAICAIGATIIEQRLFDNLPRRIKELLAGILYIIPWGIFKTLASR